MKRKGPSFNHETFADLPPARRTALHPNPKYRKSAEQVFGTVDKHGEYVPPRTGGIPTAPLQDTEAPVRARELAHERWLKKQQHRG